MIHEILLSLVGHTGGLLTISETGYIELNSKTELVSSGEKGLIEELCSLGMYYLHIDSFIKAHSVGTIFETLGSNNSGFSEDMQNPFQPISPFELKTKPRTKHIEKEIEEEKKKGKLELEIDENYDLSEFCGLDKGEPQQGVLGTYVSAFSAAAQEVLQIYTENVLLVEHEYLLQRILTIPSLFSRFSIYFQLLPQLSEAVISLLL